MPLLVTEWRLTSPTNMADVEKFQEHLTDVQREYGAFFKDKKQLELFAMIPISDRQRKELMIRMIKEAEVDRLAAEEKKATEEKKTDVK